jgi:hypothetical protein
MNLRRQSCVIVEGRMYALKHYAEVDGSNESVNYFVL